MDRKSRVKTEIILDMMWTLQVAPAPRVNLESRGLSAILMVVLQEKGKIKGMGPIGAFARGRLGTFM